MSILKSIQQYLIKESSLYARKPNRADYINKTYLEKYFTDSSEYIEIANKLTLDNVSNIDGNLLEIDLSLGNNKSTYLALYLDPNEFIKMGYTKLRFINSDMEDDDNRTFYPYDLKNITTGNFDIEMTEGTILHLPLKSFDQLKGINITGHSNIYLDKKVHSFYDKKYKIFYRGDYKRDESEKLKTDLQNWVNPIINNPEILKNFPHGIDIGWCDLNGYPLIRYSQSISNVKKSVEYGYKFLQKVVKANEQPGLLENGEKIFGKLLNALPKDIPLRFGYEGHHFLLTNKGNSYVNKYFPDFEKVTNIESQLIGSSILKKFPLSLDTKELILNELYVSTY